MKRKIDVVDLRDKLQAVHNSSFSQALLGAIVRLRNAKAIDGEKIGVDPVNGYPFKRWSIVSAERAKMVAGVMGIRMMPESGREKIKERVS